MNRSTRMRRLLAAALSTMMLLSLAACTQAPAETTAPPQTPPAVQPSESAPAETTQPQQIDYENLVTDAYRYAFRDKYGFESCYHIPKVDLESCASFNGEIERTLSEIIDRDVHEAIRECGEPFCGDMCYTWGHQDDAVSILIAVSDAYTDWTDYHTYYLSLETMEQVGKAELLDAFGLSEQQFHDRVYALLRAYWDEQLQTEAYQTVDYLKESADQMIEETLADENIRAAVPFIHGSGQLAFIVRISVPAGGGVYQALYDYETGEQLDHPTCTEDHSADFEASPEDQPVVNISAQEAYDIAREYWNYREGMIDEDTGFEMYLVDDGTVEEDGTLYYFFRLRWRVSDEEGNSWLSTVDQLYVNAETGEYDYTIYS